MAQLTDRHSELRRRAWRSWEGARTPLRIPAENAACWAAVAAGAGSVRQVAAALGSRDLQGTWKLIRRTAELGLITYHPRTAGTIRTAVHVTAHSPR